MAAEHPSWLEQATPADVDARLKVYLISFSRLLPETLVGAQGGLRSLDTLTRRQLAEFVKDAFESPAGSESGAGRPRERDGPLLRKVVVVCEKHEDDSWHFHAAALLYVPCRWPAVKRALKSRYQLAAHFSCSHREWHTALRYLVFVTTKKLEVDADRVVWLAPGETFNAFKESQEPYCAKAWQAKREKRDMNAGAAGKATAFTKFDFNNLVLSESLQTPAAVLRYVQDNGSDSMRAFVSKNQRHLRVYLAEAKEWGGARRAAAEEELTDWALLCLAADGECPHGDNCKYHCAAEQILMGNAGNWDRRRLAVALRNIIVSGPSKENRVPFLVGATNTGKSTLVESFDDLFGFEHVFHLPAVTDGKFALSNWVKEKRFVFWDEFDPVEFAAAGVFSVTTFKKAFGGKYFEVQRAQNWHDGNKDWRWQQGVVFTNKAEGLWRPKDSISMEDVRHIQSRVELFNCTHVVTRPGVPRNTIPECRVHLARWIRDAAGAYDAAQIVQLLPGAAAVEPANAADDVVVELSRLLDTFKLPPAMREALAREIEATGALHVQELTRQDWEELPSWQSVRPLERRRVLKCVAPDAS